MTSGFILIMMLHLVKGGDSRPATLDLKEIQVVCADITATVQKEGYAYVGINVKNGKEYISSYTTSEELDKEINKQCKAKGK